MYIFKILKSLRLGQNLQVTSFWLTGVSTLSCILNVRNVIDFTPFYKYFQFPGKRHLHRFFSKLNRPALM